MGKKIKEKESEETIMIDDMEDDVMAENSERILAAIDIGSNAVRLLIKKVRKEPDGQISSTKLLFVRYPLRLGFDVFGSGVVSAKKAKKLERLMKAYRQLMKVFDVDKYRACATSAIRDAKNGHTLIDDIQEETNIKIEIINGEQEAHLIYNNHFEQQEEKNENYLYVDVGGGSTEINLLSGGELVCSHSYNIGTVRMLQNQVDDTSLDNLACDMSNLRQKIEAYDPIHIIGSGGNINKLYRLCGKKNQNRSISVCDLQNIYENLGHLSVYERMETFKLKNDRADVIEPAAKIFLIIAKSIGAIDIRVPVIGLCDGLIDTMAGEE